MNNQASARNTTSEVLLTVLSGPEAGVAYKLVGQNITLGRAPESDVILQDNKSSRNHACIERRGDDYWIKDLDSTSGIFVNGKSVKETLLKSGDEILVGATGLRFGPPQPLALVSPQGAGQALGQPAPAPTGSMGHLPLTRNTNLGASDPQAAGWLPPTRSSQGFKLEETKYLSLILIGGVIIVGFLFLRSHSGSHKGTKIKDDSALEQEIADMGENNEKRQQEIMTKGKDTQQYAEAQAFYLRGFREFESTNYGRAVQNFEAALALFPNHPLAKRYLERSRLKNNELITEALERGEKDFQLERYTTAFNEYRTVLLLTNDPNNKNFQLAQKRIEAINLILMNSK